MMPTGFIRPGAGIGEGLPSGWLWICRYLCEQFAPYFSALRFLRWQASRLNTR